MTVRKIKDKLGNELEDLAIQLDNLSEKQLRKIAKIVETMKESEEDTYSDNTKDYFSLFIMLLVL